MPKEDRSKEENNSEFFDPIELVKDGVDTSLETELLELEYDLAGMRVSMEDLNTLSIKNDKIPIGLNISYENETIAPMVTFDLSAKPPENVDEKSIVDAALSEYEELLKKQKDGS